ncbi:MAG TPA: ComC/BlpC family leader-containing pheromone/bacteriocin [Kofleriaceae bacterium]|nr:ComC/BlpC family leader-containing pheromone/bacteriocin [Kofleriaceae bacterium]
MTNNKTETTFETIDTANLENVTGGYMSENRLSATPESGGKLISGAIDRQERETNMPH